MPSVIPDVSGFVKQLNNFQGIGGNGVAVNSNMTPAQLNTISGTGSSDIPAVTPSGGGGTAPQQIQVDPYAGTVFGSQAGYNQAVSDYNNLRDTTLGSVNNAIGQGAAGYNSGILDYLDQRKLQQNNINGESVQNELARQQGGRSILDMVGTGIKSGGVLLANNNAGSSSGQEAIARAYGQIGRQQMSSVGNQFAQGQAKIGTEQDNLLAQDATQSRHTQESKTNTINSIVNSATSQLASLNQAAQYASLPDRINIEAKIAEIKQQAMDALTAYDQELSGGIASQGPASADSVRGQASTLLNAGTAPTNAFDFNTEVPAQFQNTGQFASSLPIFIAPSARKQVTA